MFGFFIYKKKQVYCDCGGTLREIFDNGGVGLGGKWGTRPPWSSGYPWTG